jgi:iron complex outermembrane receptor protein
MQQRINNMLEISFSIKSGRWTLPCCLGLIVACAGARALPATAEPTDVVVTATRVPEPADEIPAFISVVSGQELRARDATDMAAALALVPGVEAPSGGDAGPSSAVPSFWGLHEFDAFLLVVDGIPWGGAFNPAITTLNFTDTERVEVLKGAAPVMYGATSFVGVVHVIHYPAGQAADEAELAVGGYGSVRGSASAVLPSIGEYRQSLSVDGQSRGFADSRESVADGRALYRGALPLGAGTLRLDADLSIVRDSPPSPVLRNGPSLAAVTPIDANFNPGDARIDEDRYHVAVGYSLPMAHGSWETLLSIARSNVTDVRAFLHPDLSGAADTQSQRRSIDDDYLDSHLALDLPGNVSVIAGADLLYGLGRQTSRNGNDAYTVPLDGSVLPPAAAAVPVNEIGTIDDQRIFTGQYAQFDWKPGRWDVIGGIRLNEAYEHKISSDLVLPPPQLASAVVEKTIVRPTETLGVSYRVWRRDADEVVTFADFRNAFKPAAVDFGPDYTPDLLRPETAKSGEAGVKGTFDGGRLTLQAALFLLDFNNLVVATSSGALANAAEERLKGVEFESRYALTPDLALAANISYHDARYGRYLFFDGSANVDVAGRQLPLSPHVLASAGLVYGAERGLHASAVVRTMGRRYLDEENTASVGGYATVDADIGYWWQAFRLTIDATNLTNQRPPVTGSEFGSQSFYLLPARMIWLRLGRRW